MSDVLDVLLEKYSSRSTDLSQALASGAIKDYEEYKYVCGQIRGLEAASYCVIELKKSMENSDD